MRTATYLLGRSLQSCITRDPNWYDHLMGHELIITDQWGVDAIRQYVKEPSARDSLVGKVLGYDDPWGCAWFREGPRWEHGPGHYNHPLVAVGKTYAYRFDATWARKYQERVWGMLSAYKFAGAFTDDFSRDWSHVTKLMTPEQRQLLYGDPNPKPKWNFPTMGYLEVMISGKANALGKLHYINGSQRIYSTTRIFWEGFGPNDDERFWSTQALLAKDGKPADIAYLRVLDREGQLHQDFSRDEIAALKSWAEGQGMILALGFLEYPADDRGSTHSWWEGQGSWPI